jgi:MoaA/NifB/PqqE/SkfB family radical SAM enzyme
VWQEMRSWKKRNYSRFNRFQTNIANGKPNNWRCRAGSRFLYICEDGLVHYCSQQRGYPGIPLAEYTQAHLDREFLTEKTCAPNCTVSCVHQISFIDFWRAPQKSTTTPGSAAGLVNIQM